MSEIALAAGLGSIPASRHDESEIRRTADAVAAPPAEGYGVGEVRLAYRTPFDWNALYRSCRAAVNGVESLEEGVYGRGVGSDRQ